MKKLNKSLQDDATKKLKKDKIWCQDGGHYQYVEVCEASCKKYTDAKPMLITTNLSLSSVPVPINITSQQQTVHPSQMPSGNRGGISPHASAFSSKGQNG